MSNFITLKKKISQHLKVSIFLSIYILTIPLAACGGNLHNPEAKTFDTGQNLKTKDDERGQDQSITTGVNIPHMIDAAFHGNESVWILPLLGTDIYYTHKSGSEWTHTSAEFIAPNSRISFVDALHGWIVGDYKGVGQIWQTSDGGSTWKAIGQLRDTHSDWDFTSAVQMKFIDRKFGWIIETFSVWRTDDGGRNWKKTTLFSKPEEQGQPTGGFFLNSNKAWVCGTKGRVFITSDGGRTWDIKNVDGFSEFSNIEFINEREGWLNSSLNGTMYRTLDGGNSWQLLPKLTSGAHLESINFIDDQLGWAVGRLVNEDSDRASTKGIVLNTRDGGLNWQPINVGGQESFFNRIHFTDSLNGWLFAQDNIYHTKNGGETWDREFSLPALK
jgi:photosystem II stability/assembly factor-like uncharacterized protein